MAKRYELRNWRDTRESPFYPEARLVASYDDRETAEAASKEYFGLGGHICDTETGLRYFPYAGWLNEAGDKVSDPDRVPPKPKRKRRYTSAERKAWLKERNRKRLEALGDRTVFDCKHLIEGFGGEEELV